MKKYLYLTGLLIVFGIISLIIGGSPAVTYGSFFIAILSLFAARNWCNIFMKGITRSRHRFMDMNVKDDFTVEQYVSILSSWLTQLEKKYYATVATTYFSDEDLIQITEQYFVKKKGKQDLILEILQAKNFLSHENFFDEFVHYLRDDNENLSTFTRRWLMLYGKFCIPMVASAIISIMNEKGHEQIKIIEALKNSLDLNHFEIENYLNDEEDQKFSKMMPV